MAAPTLVLLVLTACGSAEDSASVRIVATTTVLGDVVAAVAGPEIEVEVILPVGADPHDFRPSARQIAALDEADLVVANGLGLEEGLTDVLGSAATDGTRVLYLGEGIEPLPFDPARPDDLDPHFWLDPLRMVAAVDLIAAELELLRPAGEWRANATAYRAELVALDAEIAALLDPLADRAIVTGHRSFGYFAQRYQIEVAGVVIPGGSTLAAPSSGYLADLVATIEARDVRVIFIEAGESSRLVEAVAAETDDPVGIVEVYVGSLGGPGSGVESYVELMRSLAGAVAIGSD